MSQRLRSVLIILAVVLLDWLTKVYIRKHVSLFDMFPVIPGFFNIVHVENAGAAFSMLANAPVYIRKIALLGMSSVVMGVIAVMLWRPPSTAEGPLMRIALALVFGGALGNLIDRAFRGIVTDFVQLFFGSYEFPSFNVADSAITIGAVLLIYELWLSRKSQPKAS